MIHYYPVKTQEVAIGASSAATTDAVGTSISRVRLAATAACRIAIGKNPTATATDMYLPADKPETFVVHAGDKVAVIQESAAGKLTVTEMSR